MLLLMQSLMAQVLCEAALQILRLKERSQRSIYGLH